LGLGLHIARHIANLHGGTVTGDNEEPGGVVFRVELPRSVPARP
jgi:signal transduction histidine kinase